MSGQPSCGGTCGMLAPWSTAATKDMQLSLTHAQTKGRFGSGVDFVCLRMAEGRDIAVGLFQQHL